MHVLINRVRVPLITVIVLVLGPGFIGTLCVCSWPVFTTLCAMFKRGHSGQGNQPALLDVVSASQWATLWVGSLGPGAVPCLDSPVPCSNVGSPELCNG